MDKKRNSDQQLQALYGRPRDIVVDAWAPQLEETAISYIKNAPLMLLSSVNESGFLDISPRGGPPGLIPRSWGSPAYWTWQRGWPPVEAKQGINEAIN
jgi:hypothetical protein